MHPRVALRLVCTLLAYCLAGPLSTAGLLVAFQGESDGGVARIDLDERGQPSAPVVIFQRPGFTAAKLRVSADGRFATLNAETETGENFAILDLPTGKTPPAPPRLLALNFTPEEHRLSAGRAYVGGTDGHVIAIDLATGKIARRWNSRTQLTPPGHKPEDLLVLEPEGLLLVSHQKDGKKGRLGSRLVALRLADFSLVADLPLPRDHPELHLSEREAGPAPEAVRVDRATNTLLLTLDLYGALAFAKFDAALAGRLDHYSAEPTSANGAWGASFADRLAVARVGDRSLAVVANASRDGGLAVFDVAARDRLAFFPVESGCAEPVLINAGRTLATVVSGKQKRVAGGALETITHPGSDLLLLDIARAAAGDPAALVRTPLGEPVSQVSAVPGHADLVAATLLAPGRVVLCSATDGRILATVALPGRPVSVQPLP